MEEKFLQYLLYISFIEIRDHAYQAGNDRMFHLADLLHNIPAALDEKAAYKELIEGVEWLKTENWLA